MRPKPKKNSRTRQTPGRKPGFKQVLSKFDLMEFGLHLLFEVAYSALLFCLSLSPCNVGRQCYLELFVSGLSRCLSSSPAFKQICLLLYCLRQCCCLYISVCVCLYVCVCVCVCVWMTCLQPYQVVQYPLHNLKVARSFCNY